MLNPLRAAALIESRLAHVPTRAPGWRTDASRVEAGQRGRQICAARRCARRRMWRHGLAPGSGRSASAVSNRLYRGKHCFFLYRGRLKVVARRPTGERRTARIRPDRLNCGSDVRARAVVRRQSVGCAGHAVSEATWTETTASCGFPGDVIWEFFPNFLTGPAAHPSRPSVPAQSPVAPAIPSWFNLGRICRGSTSVRCGRRSPGRRSNRLCNGHAVCLRGAGPQPPSGHGRRLLFPVFPVFSLNFLRICGCLFL